MPDVTPVASATLSSPSATDSVGVSVKQDALPFQTIAELNENGEMTKFIAAPFLVIVGFVALLVVLRGFQRLLGPRYFGE